MTAVALASENFNDIETKVRLHEQKRCKPCRFLKDAEGVCRWADDCDFCHLCPRGAWRLDQNQRRNESRRARANARRASDLARLVEAETLNTPKCKGPIHKSNEVEGHLCRETAAAVHQQGLVQELVAEHGHSKSESTRASSEAEMMPMHFFEESPVLEPQYLRGALAKYGLPDRIIQLKDFLDPSPEYATSQKYSQAEIPLVDSESAWIDHYATLQTASQLETWLDPCAASQTSSQAEPPLVDSGSAWIEYHAASQTAFQLEAWLDPGAALQTSFQAERKGRMMAPIEACYKQGAQARARWKTRRSRGR